MKLAVLDDYQNVALQFADWSAVARRCEIARFDRNLAVPEEAAKRLAPFDIVCLMRERMPLPRALIERLPNLKFIAVTGLSNRTLDLAAATERGILVSHSLARGTGHYATPELAWALILAAARQIPAENGAMHAGGWQRTVGITLHGRTLGLLGLGRVGRRVAEIGRAVGMEVIAWSQNLTAESAASVGAGRVEKEELFRRSDVLSVHLVLSERTAGIVGARELSLMKPTAILVNTARGPLIDERALLAALSEKRIRTAALDVYEHEPLPDDHPLRRLSNVILTPHLGYVTEEALRIFYEDTVEAVSAFLDGKPIRLLNAEAQRRV